MLKITAVVSLMLIATWSQADSKRHKREAAPLEQFGSGSTLWASSLSCDSCGIECASACGTRHFRACCFNYLRKKRGPESVEYFTPDIIPDPKGSYRRVNMPVVSVKSAPEWVLKADYEPYSLDETLSPTNERRIQLVYDA